VSAPFGSFFGFKSLGRVALFVPAGFFAAFFFAGIGKS
jgi:hypothetical protein